ncbi:MAG: 2-amino-4-hydroxy-6-hydroxymethyldihydropteridine diphosphokinase [Proteobacteria bacterium]|nr:2-amino-4-hydroxy-6-hydroxymethyldihydropteridine diphosphokinase [Pseudomonadota bacterium]
MIEEVKAIIGLGSNLGNGREILREAWDTLGNVPGIGLDGLSSPYMTAPVGMTSRHWFTNAVGRLRVSLSPLDLLSAMLAVETKFDRTRDSKSFGYQDRSLDLDLLYYGTQVMDTPELILPHPRIGDRLFVLAPLVELEPDFLDYNSGMTISEMAKLLTQRITVGESKNQEIISGHWGE